MSLRSLAFRRNISITVTTALFCVGAIIIFLLVGPESNKRDSDRDHKNSAAPHQLKEAAADPYVRPARRSTANKKPSVETLHPSIQRLISQVIEAGGDADSVIVARTQLREELKGMNRSDAVSMLVDALGSGIEISTGLDFAIDQKGFLTSPESIKGLLLNELSLLDPAQGAVTAEALMNKGGLELAEQITALRAYAYGNGLDYVDAKSDIFFIEQITSVFDKTSPGIKATPKELAIFDIATFTNNSLLNDRLIDMAAVKPGRDYTDGAWTTSDAAFFALDRIVADDFKVNIEKLQQNSAWERLNGADKVMLYTRADARDPADRALVEDFVFGAGRTQAERDMFIANFPNGNYYKGNNVIPLRPSVSDQALRQMDVNALEMARDWQLSPVYPQHSVFVDALVEKLENYTGSK